MNRLLARLGIGHHEHRSVARDFSIFSGVSVASLVLLISTNLIMRRHLGPYMAGIWTALDLLPAYTAYAHLGILDSAERELPFLLGARRTVDYDRLRHTLFWIANGLGIVLALALAAGALIFRARIAGTTFIGLLIYAPYLWTQLLATYYLLLFRARSRFVELSGRQGVSNVIKAALTLAGGYGFGLFGVLAAQLVSSCILVAMFHAGLDERFQRIFDRTLIRSLIVNGLPMRAGAVAFEQIRTPGIDHLVVLSTLGPVPLGIYSISSIICQGLFYVPNALSTVMYPRFQERYGRTQALDSLRKFVELPLHLLADAMLAVLALLLIALPPAILKWLPQYADTIAPLRILLVGTYFLSLAPPAGQFLLTIRKQTSALLISVPAAAIAAIGTYAGSRYGLAGVACGMAAACLFQFVAVNAYAFSHFADWRTTLAIIGGILGRALAVLALVWAIDRLIPSGPPPIAIVGGWRLAAAAILALPLAIRATRLVRNSSAAAKVDNVEPGH